MGNRTANNKKYKKLLLFVLNNDYGNGLYKLLENNLKEKIIGKEIMEFGKKDFKNQILKYNLKNTDAIIIIEHGTELTANLIRQIREINSKVQIIGTSAIAASTIIKKMDTKITDSLICSATNFDVGLYNDLAKEFVGLYKRKYSDELGMGQAYSFDAVINFVEYWKNKDKYKEDNPKIAYSKIFQNGVGTVGKFRYNEKGDIILETILVKFSGGKLLKIK